MLLQVDPAWLAAAGVAASAAAVGAPVLVLSVRRRVDREWGPGARVRVVSILAGFLRQGVNVFSDPWDLHLLELMRERKLAEVEFHGGAASIRGAATLLRIRTPGYDLLAMSGERGWVRCVTTCALVAAALAWRRLTARPRMRPRSV